jgi:hypothetical protein
MVFYRFKESFCFFTFQVPKTLFILTKPHYSPICKNWGQGIKVYLFGTRNKHLFYIQKICFWDLERGQRFFTLIGFRGFPKFSNLRAIKNEYVCFSFLFTRLSVSLILNCVKVRKNESKTQFIFNKLF